ncbi:hypothetical protein GCM10009854_34710 [Saccharopolyspora halophila]|uniref:Uncharacterized protein n=1 Tax=Saccharopolyspora halophila TaxID=405551 RepID=A0ABN3GJZ2_9PSEU
MTMRILGALRRYLERVPRGYAADGRMLGLATSAAIESARQRAQRGGDRERPERDERQLVDARG